MFERKTKKLSKIKKPEQMLGFLNSAERGIIFDACEIVMAAYNGNVDKSGMPKAGHCMRVGMRLLKDGYPEDYVAAGFLCDIFKDSKSNKIDLKKAGITKDVIDAIEVLTWNIGEEYLEYLQRLKENDVACVVRIYMLQDDIECNNGTKDEQARVNGAMVILKAMRSHMSRWA